MSLRCPDRSGPPDALTVKLVTTLRKKNPPILPVIPLINYFVTVYGVDSMGTAFPGCLLIIHCYDYYTA